jgi:HAD superfamily hydrolase (TIGR01509 family)
MPRAILFDFNGVIIDDEAQHCEAVTATLADYGITLPPAQYYREYVGINDRECFRFTFERIGLPTGEESLRAAVERKARRYEDSVRSGMRLVPGVLEFVRAARHLDYRLAVVSGALRREIDTVLGAADLAGHFPVIISAEDVTRSKPDPEGFRLALERLGIAAGSSVVIEDSRPGLEAAQRLAIPVVMLTTSFPGNTFPGQPTWPDFLNRNPEELPWTR